MNLGEQVEYLCIASTGFFRYNTVCTDQNISAVSNPANFDREEAAIQFVELRHNILHKILCFGILFLAKSRRNMDDAVVRVLEWQRQHDLLGALHPWKLPANFDRRIPPQLAQVNQGSSTKIERKAPQLCVCVCVCIY